MLAAAAVAIVKVPTMPVVLAADIAMAVLGALFAPTVAAITVGLVRPQYLAQRLARNAACDRAGNIFAAAAAGIAGWALSLEAVFYLVPMFATLTTAAILCIPAAAIDHRRARGLDVDAAAIAPHAESWHAMLRTGHCSCWPVAWRCSTLPTPRSYCCSAWSWNDSTPPL